MNDTIIMENYLSVLKSNVEVFVHGTLESSFDDTQETLRNCLFETIGAQRRTYTTMVSLGMYTNEKISTNEISKVFNKINQ